MQFTPLVDTRTVSKRSVQPNYGLFWNTPQGKRLGHSTSPEELRRSSRETQSRVARKDKSRKTAGRSFEKQAARKGTSWQVREFIKIKQNNKKHTYTHKKNGTRYFLKVTAAQRFTSKLTPLLISIPLMSTNFYVIFRCTKLISNWRNLRIIVL